MPEANSQPLFTLAFPPFETLPRSGLIAACVTAFFEDCNAAHPVVHRKTFQDAVAAGNSSVYRAARPLALFYAAAAQGARLVDGFALTDAERLWIARLCVERARDLILAGFVEGLGSGGGGRMTEIEAVQTIFLVVQVMVSLGIAGRAEGIFQLGLRVLRKLCVGRSGVLLPSGPPRNVADWIMGEICRRLWIAMMNFHLIFAYVSNRDGDPDFFELAPRFDLPCHDVYFEHQDPDFAFRELHGAESSDDDRATVDFRPFLATPDAPTGERLVASLIEPAFLWRASPVFSAVLLANFLRHLRLRMRSFALRSGVETLRTVAKEPHELTHAELTYCDLVQVFESLCAAMFRHLPPAFGPAAAQGDAAPFFASAGAHFASDASAHLFWVVLTHMHAYKAEHWIQGDPATADERLFSSPGFLPVLEGSVLFVRMAEGQMRADPSRKGLHQLSITALSLIGALNMAAVGVMKARLPPGELAAAVEASGHAHDLRVIARYLDGIGTCYGAPAKKVADNFRRTMEALGVVPASSPVLDETGERVVLPSQMGTFVVEAVEPQNPTRTFAKIVLTSERDLAAWVPQSSAG
ncbi:hypothetical protein DFJ74DRAFT_697525 [Hyaloraphidium curvatum]|nr:hypothetical protein DFJ74DRAFT_697525 [Hyaloraphidium curvatum]